LGKEHSLNPQTDSLHPEDREILSNLALTGIARRRSEDLLFTKYQYFVREGMIKYHINEEEALDSYCEAVVSFIREVQIGRFEGRSSLKTYLYKIFLNKCVDLLRKNSTNKNSIFLTSFITDRIEQFSDNSRTILQRLIDKSDHQKLRKQMELIGEKCHKMLLLWADSYSDREIAAELQINSANVVKTSRLRCLEKLKQLYKAG
jgi:RNA polymerase sigma-70 factor (ECF subfamily)